uniref:Uncharacterized protein n=1 Tax=Eiseniibacteriota bacterium TaxID=2212470 RepID=A0A832MKY5_UNCEI
MIRADNRNGEVRGRRFRGSGLRVERVTDRRGGLPEALGRAASDPPERQLVLSEPLAGFLARCFYSESAQHAPIRLALAIERFELTASRTSAGPRAEVHARIAVALEDDGAETALGWVEHDAVVPASLDLVRAQEALLYQAIRAIGEALGRDEIGARAAAGGSPHGAGALPTVHAEVPRAEAVRAWSTRGSAVHFRSFTESVTSDAYGGATGLCDGVPIWSRGRQGYYASVEFLTARGTPRVVADTSWVVEKSELSMWALTLGVDALYGIFEQAVERPLFPYVGLGVQFTGGSEKLGATGYRRVPPVETFSGSTHAVRFAFGVQAVAGMEFRLSPQFAAMIEGRYHLGGNGSTAELPAKTDEAEDKAFRATLHSLVERSNYNLSGWGIAVGFRFFNTEE